MNPISLQLCFCFIVFITILKLACTRRLSSQKVGFSVSSMSMSSAVRITSYNVLSTNLGISTHTYI